jgi:hypothetical protein
MPAFTTGTWSCSPRAAQIVRPYYLLLLLFISILFILI